MELNNLQILLQYFVDAVPFGALLALIAVGYTMVYGIIQLVNFAHGEIFMFAAYFLLTLLTPLDPGNPAHTLWGVSSAVIVGITWVYTFNAFLPKQMRGALRWAVSIVGGVAVGFAMWPLFRMGMGFWAAYALTLLHTAALGVTIDRIAYKPLRESPRLTALITAIGVSFFLFNLSQGIWEARPRTYPSEAFPEGTFLEQLSGPQSVPQDRLHAFILGHPEDFGITSEEEIRGSHRRDARLIVEAEMGWWEMIQTTGRIRLGGGINTNVRDVVILAFCVFSMIALWYLVQRTKMGRAMRACSMDKTTSKLVGIDVDHVVAVTFVVGSALAAVAAPLYVLKGNTLLPTMGYIVGLLAFASAVLGGIGNIPGALMGGFMIGVITNMAPAHSQLTWPGFMPEWFLGIDPTKWSYGVAYFVLILVIVVRPTGILGKATATRA